MALKQDNRLLKFHSPVGDRLFPQRMVAEELLSDLYSLEVELISERDNIFHKDLLGKEATLEITRSNGKARFWSGYVRRFEREASVDAGYRYRAELVPWLWFLTQNTDSRIFQNQSTSDILTAIFGDLGFSDFEMRLSGTPKPLEYCVQYEESSFTFISRLLEQSGLHYFFEHNLGKHTLVIGDTSTVHPPTNPASVKYQRDGGATDDADSISTWVHRQVMRAGRWALDDYNFEKPDSDISVATATVAKAGPNDKLEHFNFPGGFGDRSTGEDVARFRMESEEAHFERMSGSGNCRGFAPGAVFKLQGHPVRAYNDEFLICRVRHHAMNNLDDETQDSYENTFECLPKTVPFRPLRQTPLPNIRGLQSGVVVGPSGEEIHTDKYGRVRVQFHWDRRGTSNERSSCWMRVAQSVAGKGWGFLATPRIGQEVLIDFLYGDPDRPVVVGGVYNAAQRTPYDLPADATVTGVKTNSSKGGGGFNEFRLDDRKGSELVYLHAERDHEVRVKNDQKVLVKGEQHELVEKDRFQQTKADYHLTVGGMLAMSVKQDSNVKVGAGLAASAGTTVSLKAGTMIVIEAGQQISLKAGPSTIVLGPAGVTIDGPMVKMNSGGSAGSAQSPAAAKPPKQARDGKGGESSSEQRAMAKRMKEAAARGSPFVKMA